MAAIDVVIVATVLLVTLIIGVVDRRRVTLEDYWVNGRRTGAFVLVATIFSTFVGVGAILGNSGVAFGGGGLAALAIPLSFLFYLVIFNLFFAPKIKEFGDKHKSFTIPDFLEIRYSSRVRLIGAIVNLIGFGLYTALQILGIAVLVNALTGINPTLATLLGGGIAIIYTTFGGLRADIRTDVFQFFVMLLLFLVFLPIIITKGGGFGALASLPSSVLLGEEFAPWYVFVLAFFFVGASVLASADIWQRIYSARDKKSILKSRWWIVILVFAFMAMGTLLGLYGKILLPDASSNTVVADLLRMFLPVGLYGLVLAGFFAAIMSSVDSMIIITSMTIVRDIYHKGLRKELDHEKTLRLSRIVSLVVGLLGLIIALLIFDIVHLAVESISFFVVLLPTIVFGFYWKRASEKAAFWSILFGMLSIIVFIFVDPVQAFIPGTLVSFAVFVAVALLTKDKTTPLTTNHSKKTWCRISRHQ